LRGAPQPGLKKPANPSNIAGFDTRTGRDNSVVIGVVLSLMLSS